MPGTVSKIEKFKLKLFCTNVKSGCSLFPREAVENSVNVEDVGNEGLLFCSVFFLKSEQSLEFEKVDQEYGLLFRMRQLSILLKVAAVRGAVSIL